MVPADSANFPVYESIKPNITFWENVFARYTRSQGILHDQDKLEVVYEVVRLVEPNQPGSKKKNRDAIKAVRKKYEALLLSLIEKSRGQEILTSDEMRVASLHGPSADSNTFKQAIDNMRFQQGVADQFLKGLERSAAYLDSIKRIFRDKGVPEDLAYLPHVESSFNPRAYSKFGAAGLWQFIRSTGRLYMKIDYTVDERRDPLIATRAAARLLKRNYQILGSWPLALTAYNHGVNGMLKAKRAKGGYEKIFLEYKGRRFRFASRNFYSEFLAVCRIAKNYQAYFKEVNFHEPLKRDRLILTGYVSAADLMEFFQLDPGTFKKFNPALREPVYTGQKYIPPGTQVYFPIFPDSAADRLAATFPADKYKSEQKASKYHRAVRGETAEQIASRHKISLRDLIALNDLNLRATIYPGQNLRLPAKGEAHVQIAKAKKPEPAPPPIKAPKPRPVQQSKPAKPKAPPVQVAKPESRKAAPEPKREAPRKSVRILESISDTSLQPPEVITETMFASIAPCIPRRDCPSFWLGLPETAALPVRSAAEDAIIPTIVAADLAVEPDTSREGKPAGIIRVEVEETLGHYADWLNVSTGVIRRMNGLSFGRPITRNQKLRIPFDKISMEKFESRRYEYHKEMVEDFFSAFRVNRTESYTVKRNDNLWKLCEETFEIPLWLLQQYNPDIIGSVLHIGQMLRVPVIERASVEF